MLDIVLEENENSHGIPKGFGRAMVALACLSFLLSLLQLAENKLEDGTTELRKKLAVARNVVEIAFVNLPFLTIRLVIFSLYSIDESIFIAKNSIAIILSSLEIYWIKTGQC